MAATYYVDNTNPACAAAGPGTPASPYCTISAAATQHPGAGNTIQVLAGTYREQISVPASGASGSPFVVQASSPAVTMDGADDFSSASHWELVSGDVWLTGDVTWAPKQVFADGARLTASTAAPAAMPARTFQYVAGAGLYVNAGEGGPAGHGTLVGRRSYGFTISGKSWVTVRGFRVIHAEDKGIQVTSASSQCEVSDNQVALSFKYGILISGSTGCRVARNVISDNGGHGIALTGGSTGCTIEDNESFRNADPLVRVANGLYLFGSPGNVLQRNRYHDNQDSGQHLQSASSNCTSIQNRSWNNGDHGFDHLGSDGTIHVGDVAWGNSMDGFSIEGSATGTQLYNCIATDNGLTTGEYDLWVELSSVSGFVSNDNLFWNSTAQPPVKYVSTQYALVSDYSAATGQDSLTIQADPRFMNPAAGDFRLLAGSPAIDNANSAVPGFPAADARGLARMDDPATGNAGVGPVPFADRGALEYMPAMVSLAPSTGASPLSVTANASGSLGPDGTVASYRFDFGDGTIAGPQAAPTATHTYTTGEWTTTVTVTDQSGGTGTATASVIVTAPNVTALDRRIAASSDDAEEPAGSKPVTNDIDLELVYDASNQTVGMRWPGLAIPPHAFIQNAFVQFTSRNSRSEATSLTIRGQAADHALAFTTASGNVSTRPRTAAGVNWAPSAWTTGLAGAAQRTPDLSAVIDEITNRAGWASGNALALIVTGSGRRVAWAYDGSSAAAPLLHVEYTPDYPPVARLSAQQIVSPALTVSADASASTDPDAAPIATYRFDFGDGTPAVTTVAPSAIGQHAYAMAGTYLVTLVATDTRGLASPVATASVTVNGAPVARIALSQLPSPPLTVRADASASTDPDPMPIASYRFDFGDGSAVAATTAPNAVAQHAYAAPGPYTVRVTATDAGGLASTATGVVTVDAPPTARIAAAQVASPALTVNADASSSTDGDATPIASYRFAFGDGTPAVTTTAPTANAQHTYAAAGIYTITLIAIDTGGYASSAAAMSLTVNGAPVARLSATQLPSPAMTVSADASGSTDPDAMPIAGYRFDFGDGTPAVTTTAPAALAQHAYAAPGPYTVTVTVTDAGGLTSTATAPVTVDAPPVARLTAAQIGSPALTVSADGSASTDGDATPVASYRFDFGDGTPAVTTLAPAATTQHTYAAAGAYILTLVANDTGGYASAPATASVTVNGAPVARLSVAPAASPPLTVSADASASTDPDPMPIASYRFDFGDGTPAVTTLAPAATAQHTYAAAGTYTVRVTATDRGALGSPPASATLTVDSAPIARLTVTQPASPPLTVNADGSASTDSDGMPIASYRFDFGDGTAPVTTTAPTATAQHTYAAAGLYTVTLVATDTFGLASTPMTTAVAFTTQSTLDQRVASQSDDAEEPAGGKPVTSSNDLELVFDTAIQTVGMRWAAIAIPQRATITKAYLQFAAKEAQSEATSLTIRGQAADNPTTFSTGTANVSSRPRTTAAVTWTPVAWNAGEAGANQRTPDLKAVIQEIVNRTGWVSGNALAIIVTGTGHRTAWSYNGSTSLAPLLHVEYTTPPPPDAPPVARLTVAQVTSPMLTVNASGSASTDSDGTPIASYRFTFGDGTPAVTTTAPTAAAQHTYAAAGVYTVTLTATDTGGLASTAVTQNITVVADNAPVARITATQAASPPLTVSADGSASTDTDAWPIASYRFNFGDGTPAVTTTAPTAAAQHTYLAPGAYTLTLVATDSGGLASAAASQSITVTAAAVDSAPLARLSVTPAASPPFTAIADGSASSDGDATPIASYRFDFGDGTPAVTTTAPTATAQHTYATPGTYTVTLVATDSGAQASAPAAASITFAAPAAFERRIAAWLDDVEEVANGTIYVNSGDLELVVDGSWTQTVGMRWPGVTIPAGATITSAWIQFAAKEAQSEATSLTFRAEASDNAPSFGSSTFNLTARTRTASSTAWAPVPWSVGEAGSNQRTPDLAAVIQEVVARPGWASGNAVAIIVNGSGHRTAWAYDGSASAAPLLHVDYIAGAAAMASAARAERTADAPPVALPGELSLAQARPNPAAGPVSFRLDLPARSTIRWGIYDLQGRRVWTEEREFAAGTADLSWNGREADGSPARPGLYFARVRADNRVLMRRFIRL